MYMPPYEGAVKAGTFSYMCSNNRVNQLFSCENGHDINYLLHQKLNFSGFVLSDYRGTQSTVGAALGGLDIQMPGCVRPSDSDPLICASDSDRPNYFGLPLKKAVLAGKVPQSAIDAKVLRIMTAMYSIGAMDTPKQHTPSKNTTSPARNQLARRLSRESIVLLRNQDGILPLSAKAVSEGTTSIAVIGPAAHSKPISGGGGSGSVVPYYVVTVLDGILNAVAAASDAGVSREGKLELDSTSSQHGVPQFVAGACSGQACLGSPSVSYYNGTDPAGVQAAAKAADVAIVVLATTSSEGKDRLNLDLPDLEDLLSNAL